MLTTFWTVGIVKQLKRLTIACFLTAHFVKLSVHLTNDTFHHLKCKVEVTSAKNLFESAESELIREANFTKSRVWLIYSKNNQPPQKPKSPSQVFLKDC